MNFKAVMFDLDGTLLDTLEDIADSMNAVLQREGFKSHALTAYQYFIGDGVEKMVFRALPQDQRQELMIMKCVQQYRAEYGRNWTRKTKPFQEITELLDELEKNEKKLAVLTNKPDDAARKMIAHYFPGPRFAMVLGARNDIPRKPDPQGAFEIAARLSLELNEFLYLGDMATDMETAIAAGMFPVGVSWGYRSPEELKGCGARLILDRPLDLLDHLY
ncbi:MAG: HAD family hydrolase [Deltaproteobacteria bacterium]|nr:HAD family hydrolase [Deltaproteobacteria bacterium]